MRISIRFAKLDPRGENNGVLKYFLVAPRPLQQPSINLPVRLRHELRVDIGRNKKPSTAKCHGGVIGKATCLITVNNIKILEGVLRQPHFMQRSEYKVLTSRSLGFSVIRRRPDTRGTIAPRVTPNRVGVLDDPGADIVSPGIKVCGLGKHSGVCFLGSFYQFERIFRERLDGILSRQKIIVTARFQGYKTIVLDVAKLILLDELPQLAVLLR